MKVQSFLNTIQMMSVFQTIVTAHIKLRPYLQTNGAHYSHLSNKCEVTLTGFEKTPPTKKKKNLPSTFIDFLHFFCPPLLIY